MLIAILSVFVLAGAAPLLHRRLPQGWTAPVLAALPAMLAVYFAARSAAPHVEAYEWVPALGIRLSFAFDGLSRLFAILITGIGALVLVYAGAYLHGHVRLGRFHAYLLAFMASMLGVVLADNLLLLFVFWELTSLTSYLLIGFDQHRAEARAAALQSLLVTAGGGLALLAGVLLLGRIAGTYELSALAGRADAILADPLYVPALLLLLAGAFTKSAQVPFHFWLPAAMAAPTPASAYLHSSTMVKAGVYLIARLVPVLGGTLVWQALVGGAGALTMIVGGAMAIGQTDVKRLLAYATVSALGLMTMLLGIGGEAAVTAAVVYLFAHALYKGALFLVAGSISHATGERDVTKLGGLRAAMPITAAAAAAGALSMAGLPPFAGFLGKELTLEAVWRSPILPLVLTAATAVGSMLLVAAGLQAGIRPFAGRRTAGAAHEGPPALWLGAAILAASGLAAGVAPNLVAGPLVDGAVSAIVGRPTDVALTLWHGWNAALIFSTLSLAAGIALYFRLAQVRERLPRPGWLIPGPSAWYARAFDGLNRLAEIQTRALQSGYLRRYLLVTVGVTIALVGAALVIRAPQLAVGWADVRLHELALSAAVLLAAAGAVRSQSYLAAVAALGTVGFGIALIFAMFGAPDLAMTQLVVEALLVILFVLVLHDLPRGTPRSTRPARARDLALALTAGGLMTALVLAATTIQIEPPVSHYFLEQSVPLAHGHNVVNVILVDFRAIDTLGEITVIAIAGLGVHALIRLRPGRTQA